MVKKLGVVKAEDGVEITLALANDVNVKEINKWNLIAQIAKKLPVAIHPNAPVEEIFNLVKNPKNWKDTVMPIAFDDKAQADTVAKALAYYLGGAEFYVVKHLHKDVPDTYVVASHGYYHYVGA